MMKVTDVLKQRYFKLYGGKPVAGKIGIGLQSFEKIRTENAIIVEWSMP